VPDDFEAPRRRRRAADRRLRRPSSGPIRRRRQPVRPARHAAIIDHGILLGIDLWWSTSRCG
jgi:hypothetical protein